MGLRIMFMANAPWCSTGYGIQGKHVTPRWQALGHEVAYFAFHGLTNGLLHNKGIAIYPVGFAPWGVDVISAHMRHFRADVLVTLLDVWVLDKYGEKAAEGGWAWCPWTPIDQEPVPNLILQRLQGAYCVLPYAKHGEEQLKKAGVQNTRYIPHGVDCNVFKPGDKLAARKALGIPEDRFIIGMVAANKGYPSRKCFAEQLLAFAGFKKTYPDALFYLHTLRTAQQGGIDFDALCARLGLKIGQDVLFSDQYSSQVLGWPEERMALLYQAFDCLSEVSAGEGFGIPLVEAQACGVPVIAANNTAMTELTFAGILVNEQQPWWTPLGSWAMIPAPAAVEEAYGNLYEALHNEVTAAELREKARAGALQFDWDRVVADFWRPFFEQLGVDLGIRASESAVQAEVIPA